MLKRSLKLSSCRLQKAPDLRQIAIYNALFAYSSNMRKFKMPQNGSRDIIANMILRSSVCRGVLEIVLLRSHWIFFMD